MSQSRRSRAWLGSTASRDQHRRRACVCVCRGTCALIVVAPASASAEVHAHCQQGRKNHDGRLRRGRGRCPCLWPEAQRANEQRQCSHRQAVQPPMTSASALPIRRSTGADREAPRSCPGKPHSSMKSIPCCCVPGQSARNQRRCPNGGIDQPVPPLWRTRSEASTSSCTMRRPASAQSVSARAMRRPRRSCGSGQGWPSAAAPAPMRCRVLMKPGMRGSLASSVLAGAGRSSGQGNLGVVMWVTPCRTGGSRHAER